METLVVGEDGNKRCSWGSSSEDYIAYHDLEWGRPTTDEVVLFEKMCLEGFQSGLSWITILRKREGFREAFKGFELEAVASFDNDDVERLVQDTKIVRHRGKIEATIANAKALLALHESGATLAGLIWSYEPADSPPTEWEHVASKTPESTALSKDLKKRGFRFVGPTTAYAAMQAMGIVNDHFVGCWKRQECEAERSALTRPAAP